MMPTPRRSPHSFFQPYLGRIICVSDHQAAAERDREFLSGQAVPPPSELDAETTTRLARISTHYLTPDPAPTRRATWMAG